MFTLDISKGIIAQGNPDCNHREMVVKNHMEHEIGVCMDCGRTKDYTILREKDEWNFKGKALKGGMNMDLIMKQSHPKLKK